MKKTEMVTAIVAMTAGNEVVMTVEALTALNTAQLKEMFIALNVEDAEKKEAKAKAETALTLAFDFIRSADTTTNKAIALMTAHGYVVDNDYKVNGVAFKAAKSILKNAIEIDIAPFNIGDKSTSDKKYATYVTIMSRSCNEGLTNGKPVVEREPATPKGMAPKTAVNRVAAKIEPIELTEDDLKELDTEIDFKGNIADFVETYEIELFKYIASDEEILSRLLALIAKSPKVKE
jgi:hypothetical protein